MNRIPPIITPLNEDSGDINSLWYRYWQSLATDNAGIPDAPSDGVIYGRRDAAWIPVPTDQPVNLGYTEAPDQGTVTNSDGTDAVIPLFSATRAGLVPTSSIADGTKVLFDDGVWRPTASAAPIYWDCLAANNGDLSKPNDVVTGVGAFVLPTYSAATFAQSLPRAIVRNNGASLPFGFEGSTNRAVLAAANSNGTYRLVAIFGFDSPLSSNYSFLTGLSSGGFGSPDFTTSLNSFCGFGIRDVDSSLSFYRNVGGAAAWQSVATGIARPTALTAFRLVIEFDGVDLFVSLTRLDSANSGALLFQTSVATFLPVGSLMFPVLSGFAAASSGPNSDRAFVSALVLGKLAPVVQG